VDRDAIEQQIVRIRRRLTHLNAEKAGLETTLASLEHQLSAIDKVGRSSPLEGATVTNGSPASDKIALFRRLFAGRPDVFPVRWENRKTGRTGYSPACFNEWTKGICGKPKVKCGECPHQAFIHLSDEIIERHLRGGDATSRSAWTGRIGKAILPTPWTSIVGMKIWRIPPTQKSPGRSTERRLSSNAVPIDDMVTRASGIVLNDRHSRRGWESRNYTKRTHTREITVVRHQCGRVDRQCASRLNSIRKLEAERRSQPRSAFRNVDVKRDRLPRFEDRTVTPRERVISCLQWPAQHFGDGDGRDREAQVPGSMGIEERLEVGSEFRVSLQEVDDGCRIDEKQRVLRQIPKI
jgi:hypothetical protein